MLIQLSYQKFKNEFLDFVINEQIPIYFTIDEDDIVLYFKINNTEFIVVIQDTNELEDFLKNINKFEGNFVFVDDIIAS